MTFSVQIGQSSRTYRCLDVKEYNGLNVRKMYCVPTQEYFYHARNMMCNTLHT